MRFDAKRRNIQPSCEYKAESSCKRARVGLRNEAALLKIETERTGVRFSGGREVKERERNKERER